MYYNQSFDEMPEDMLLHGKLKNDGGHNLFQRDPPPSRWKKRRRKYVDKEVEVDDSLLESAKKAVESKEVKKDVIEQNTTETPLKSVEIQAVEEEPVAAKNTQDKPNKMPLRKLFDELYDTWLNLKWKTRRNMLINALKPYFEKDYKKTVAFVDSNLDRRRHNTGSRFRRARNKCNLNRFNYFVTFTYSDAKMDRETFKKKLRAYLKNKVNRSGWKYYGVWEGWDGTKRLHFHALMYIPNGTMPGELVKERRYNTNEKRMKDTIGNTEFNEKFGRSDVEEIIEQAKDSAYQYVLKYLNSVLYYDDARTQAIDFANFDISKAAVNGTTITVYAKASFLFDGEGTSTSPYQIKTADDLKLFAQKVNAGQTYAGKYFVLTGNIDLGAGTAWTPINVGFAGTLDGGNYTVSNVNINTTERKTGFFVELNAGTIKNLKLNVTITSTNEVVGGLVGSTTGDVTIENCEISGSITALKSVGGIVAYVGGNITIKNCINNASITLTNTGAATNVFTGGVIGATVGNTKTVFDGCVNKGNVQATGLYIGGVAGLLRAGSTGSEIKNSYNYGNVITGANSGWVAGVVGCNRIAMTDCYCLNTATISVGTSSQAASAYAASSSAKTTIGYLACTSTGIVATGGGLCDENGDPVQ